MRTLLPIVLLVGLAAQAFAQQAPQAELRLDGQPHAGVRFGIVMNVVGFDESPAPAQPKLEIPGARVTPLGVDPSVSQSIRLDHNGQQTVYKRVTWTFRWSVEIDKPGRVKVPAVTATQGTKRVTAQAGELQVEDVPTTDDMKID